MQATATRIIAVPWYAGGVGEVGLIDWLEQLAGQVLDRVGTTECGTREVCSDVVTVMTLVDRDSATLAQEAELESGSDGRICQVSYNATIRTDWQNFAIREGCWSEETVTVVAKPSPDGLTQITIEES
ncbi:MAG: hypothetical protein AB1411_15765 [Nitrospirota bacterium]